MYMFFQHPAAPGCHLVSRDRATVPSPTHTAALAISGERMGVAAKHGQRNILQSCSPGDGKYSLHFLSAQRGRALHSGHAERESKSVYLCFFALFTFFCCTASAAVISLYAHGFVGCWWMGFSAVLLYCCTIVHTR